MSSLFKFRQSSVSAKPDEEMSFFDHLEELRWHIIRSLVAVLVCGIAVFASGNWVFDYIIFAPKNADFITFRLMCRLSHALGLGERMCVTPLDLRLQSTTLGENFFMQVQVAMIVGLIMAFPYVFWEFWRFIKPGLLHTERRVTRFIVFICSTLFSIGCLFGYFIIAPFAINFLGGYAISQVVIVPTFSSYIGMMIMFVLPIGLIFELPVVVYFLSQLGLVTPQLMREFRRHAVIVILLLGAIVTPSPDVMSMLMVALPLQLLYEVSIFVSAGVQRKWQQTTGQ